ncbi:hypothetical protein IQ254_10510 [Nodosilinea sp. LEGE 07088]|uniref:hypothetical protein n=1 Tax=Nodosilinea sp. LEGE 07088 TaxID=2777968 RepID=UPI00187E287E|nr:hypothetical protein [Nodosilinea sp. LEGE 07088]MBE9137641.1 hypothetical protein [Nodosilinea sp. LEGE 07088]
MDEVFALHLLRRLLMMLAEYRPHHDHEGLVCPRCGKRTVVLHGDSTYVCLDQQCGFRHDVSGNGGGPGGFIAAFFGVIFLFALL